MSQTELFRGRQLRDQGMQRVQSHNQAWLEVARAVAGRIAARQGVVCTDDVREQLDVKPDHPNAWGAVFKSPEFEPTGRFVQSRTPSRHASVQRQWRLKEG